MQKSHSSADMRKRGAIIPVTNIMAHGKPNLKINKDDLLNRIASTSKVIENILSALQPNSNTDTKT